MGTADGDPEVQRKADGRALRHRAASGAVQPTAGKSHALGVAAAVHGSVVRSALAALPRQSGTDCGTAGGHIGTGDAATAKRCCRLDSAGDRTGSAGGSAGAGHLETPRNWRCTAFRVVQPAALDTAASAEKPRGAAERPARGVLRLCGGLADC